MTPHFSRVRFTALLAIIFVSGCATRPAARMFSALRPQSSSVVSNSLPSQQTDPVARLSFTEEAWLKKAALVSYEQPASQPLSKRAGSSGCAFG